MYKNYLPIKVDSLRRSDVSDQLREAKEHISALEEEKERSAALLAQARSRREQLERELREGEVKWRETMEQVSSCGPPLNLH